jgi:hypothetical protein
MNAASSILGSAIYCYCAQTMYQLRELELLFGREASRLEGIDGYGE